MMRGMDGLLIPHSTCFGACIGIQEVFWCLGCCTKSRVPFHDVHLDMSVVYFASFV